MTSADQSAPALAADFDAEVRRQSLPGVKADVDMTNGGYGGPGYSVENRGAYNQAGRQQTVNRERAAQRGAPSTPARYIPEVAINQAGGDAGGSYLSEQASSAPVVAAQATRRSPQEMFTPLARGGRKVRQLGA
jgi:hypothetical protein